MEHCSNSRKTSRGGKRKLITTKHLLHDVYDLHASIAQTRLNIKKKGTGKKKFVFQNGDN
jgi:hypothetical protein